MPLHKDEDSEVNKTAHIELLNNEINEIYEAKPPTRLLPHADVQFFKTKKDEAKKYKLQRKELWVRDAKRIIETYAQLSDNRGNLTHYMYIRRRRDG